MVLSFDADGSQAITSTETFLFGEQTTEATYFCYVHLNTMASGDVYIIRTYVEDGNASVPRVIYEDTISFSDIDGQPTYYIPPLPTQTFRVSIQKTSGTDRTFTWQRGTF